MHVMQLHVLLRNVLMQVSHAELYIHIVPEGRGIKTAMFAAVCS